MCGIVGFRTKRGFSRMRASLPDAASRLIHRGPDDTGLFFDEKAGVGLGHRRLSVIDLSEAGRQPMASDDGTVLIAYNGEVYNFKEVRTTLKGYGHLFRTETDTEVILKAYLQWGIDCLSHFVGMFALALWDKGRNGLVLARDRLGLKPLYYHVDHGCFLFASELKALMAFKDFQRDIDSDAIPLFLHYQYVPAPRTIFRNTYKLLPGHYLIYDGDDLKTGAYWTLPHRGALNFEGEEEELVDELDRILGEAVSDRLISDVPLGALLSGGIDSSLVVALMQKASHTPVRTFSIGFREPGYDEAPWASRVARHLGTEHKELYVRPGDAIQVIPRLPEIYDEPFADASAIPTCLVSKLARTRVTVALSGDGGDEQFAGYVRYWSARAMAMAFQRMPAGAGNAVGRTLERVPLGWVKRCHGAWRRCLPDRFNVANFVEKWQKLVRLTGAAGIEELYRMTICLWSEPEVRALSGRGLASCQYEGAFQETPGWPLLSRLMRVDQKTYLPDDMLTKVDRASMAFSLEVRVPLLDHRVLEFSSGIPDGFNRRKGKGKYLLRKLLGRYVPEALFERPKMGFSVPIDRWFRSELKDLLLDYLSVERLKKEGRFNHNLVEKMIIEHLSGQANHPHRLWALLMWEMWRDRWLA